MLKVGDKVRIRKDLCVDMIIGLGVIYPMVELAGSTQEVVSIFGNCVRLKNVGWTWHKDTLEPIPTQSIHITADGDTVHAVLKESENVVKRAKAVCSSDFEVGAKLAMERLFDNSNVVREVARPAKVGEWVKVTNASGYWGNEYQNGDILQIVKHNHGNPSGAYYRNARFKYLNASEYVVLENYTPPTPEPPKFTFADFKAGKFAVHCDTQAKAKEFLSYLHGKGLRWQGGKPLIGYTDNWNDNESNTCYLFALSGVWYGDQNVQVREDRRVIIYYNHNDLD